MTSPKLCLSIMLVLLSASLARADDLLRIEGPENSHLANAFADGGLPPLPGVRNIQIFRASRDVPSLTDGKGFTYNHHVDIACWKGRLYVAWENGQRDEDTWPGREVFSTSVDGLNWSPPRELFPMGISNPLRMYFYHAANDRMLVIAARRITHDRVEDVGAGGVVVREIRADHSLAPVYTLIRTPAAPADIPDFTAAADPAMIQACRQLLADHTFLEQQDFGELLGDRRMQAYESAPSDFGKAFCFFHRGNQLLGICKKGYIVQSNDDGKTWSDPAQLHDFISGTAKEWIQQIPTGKFIWAHDPFPVDRFPLVMLTSDHGFTFSNMRVVHGEVPRQRYAGLYKNLGPQYVRGISFWNTDHSRAEPFIYLAYSVNKEDIWVSRMALPIQPNATLWHVYAPKWTGVTIRDDDPDRDLTLEDHDPYDYALAERTFPAAKSATLNFDIVPRHLGNTSLEIELWDTFGDRRPVRLALTPGGTIESSGTVIAQTVVNHPIQIKLRADASAGQYELWLNASRPTSMKFSEPATTLSRLVFRTGPYRKLPMRGEDVPPGSDRPAQSTQYDIAHLTINTAPQ